LDNIKPDFFGTNSYSNTSAKISGVLRSYFYLDKKGIERKLEDAKFLYTCVIEDEKNLYNIDLDNLKIVKGLQAGQDIYKVLKDKGYLGAIGNNDYKCAVLFYAKKIIEKEKR